MGGRERNELACRKIVRDLSIVVVENGVFLLGIPFHSLNLYDFQNPAIQSENTPTVAISLTIFLGDFNSLIHFSLIFQPTQIMNHPCPQLIIKPPI